MTREEENKAVVRRLWEEVINGGNLDVVDEVFASTCKLRSADDPAHEISSPRNIGTVVQTLRTAYPDLRVTIEEQIAEGDKVVTRWTCDGTHQGEVLSIAPTGRQMEAQGITISRVSAGKIEETLESSTFRLVEPLPEDEPTMFLLNWFRKHGR